MLNDTHINNLEKQFEYTTKLIVNMTQELYSVLFYNIIILTLCNYVDITITNGTISPTSGK